MDKSNPMDWVAVLVIVQLLGMKYLMAATDGWHFVNITAHKRKVTLIIGLAIIWIPYLLVWAFYGHSPADMWDGATAWWNAADIGFIGKVIAIAGWWMLLSLFQALFAIWMISRAVRRERLEDQTIVY